MKIFSKQIICVGIVDTLFYILYNRSKPNRRVATMETRVCLCRQIKQILMTISVKTYISKTYYLDR